MSGLVEKVLNVARNELGYCEKKDNNYLDEKYKNAGKNNYTKYGRDLAKWTNSGSTYGVNYQWCDQFVDWCMCVAFGVKNAQKMLIGWSAYTPTSSDFYKKKKQWHEGKDVQPGDQIFFKNSKRIHHTGIVEYVMNGEVHTIEGNTNPGSGVESDGGKVARKTYKITDKSIAGYGRPDYKMLEVDDTEPGWHYDANGVWYRHTKGTGPNTYYHAEIREIGGKIYAFNEGGYLIRNNKDLIKLNTETGEIFFSRG